MNATFEIKRIRDVKAVTGMSRSVIYRDMQAGTFPLPVKLGPRASGWPSSEIQALIAARIAGKSADEIRDLVAKMHKARAKLAA